MHPVHGAHSVNKRTAVGLRVKDGVVLAVEKLAQSPLLVPGSNRRILSVTKHIGLVRSLRDAASTVR